MADEVFEYLIMSIVQNYCNKQMARSELIESIEALGYRVGNGIIGENIFRLLEFLNKDFDHSERIAPDSARLTDEVSIMKYICKGKTWQNNHQQSNNK